jgi:hypothetical protein
MATVVELIGVSVKPIVGKELSAKDLVPDRFLDDESRRRISRDRDGITSISDMVSTIVCCQSPSFIHPPPTM